MNHLPPPEVLWAIAKVVVGFCILLGLWLGGICLFTAGKTRPREVACVSYLDGDRMIRYEGWRLAPEEDTNRRIGWVWIERDAPKDEDQAG